MNRSFPYIKLKEVCDVNQGLQIPIEYRFTENAPNRYFYITVQFLKASHINKFYVENPPISSICKDDDILIVRTGSTGQIVTGVSGCFHNNFFKVNFNKKLIHGRYLYHCLNTKEKYKEMLRRAGVTTIPDLNHFMFLDMEIPIPKKERQIEIAKILDILDSKIDINNRINAELEQMAKTIYDYWFVQFDFPMSAEHAASIGQPDLEGKPYKSSGGKMVWNRELKRDVPEGWEVKKLEEIVEIKYGKDHKDINTGLIPVYGSGGVMRYADRALYENESILIPRKGTLSNLFYLDQPFWSVDTMFYTKMKIMKSGKYLFYTLDNMNLASLNVGTAVPSLTSEVLNKLKILLPPLDFISQFDKKLTPMFAKNTQNKTENQELTSLRDWLLPMLMNGQVRVGDVKEDGMVGMAAEPVEEYKVRGK